jgi:hypothetical protein
MRRAARFAAPTSTRSAGSVCRRSVSASQYGFPFVCDGRSGAHDPSSPPRAAADQNELGPPNARPELCVLVLTASYAGTGTDSGAVSSETRVMP